MPDRFRHIAVHQRLGIETHGNGFLVIHKQAIICDNLGILSFIKDIIHHTLEAVSYTHLDVYKRQGFPIYYKDKLYLRPKVLTNNLRIIPGTLYNEQNVQRTYSNYGRLCDYEKSSYPPP